MRNVLALLGAGLLAGCCLMHVPITEQTQANARTFGSLGQRLLPEDTPPERIAAFRQCLSEAYMEHYGEGEAGTAREREDGYALFWQTVMAAAPTYDHLATYDIHVGLFSRLPAWCDPPTGVPPSPRLLDDMGTPPAAGPELP